MPKIYDISLATRAAALDKAFVLAAYAAGHGCSRIAWYLAWRDAGPCPATTDAVRLLLEQEGVKIRTMSEAIKIMWWRRKEDAKLETFDKDLI